MNSIQQIEDLGYAIEAHGIDADPVALILLAHTARDLGVCDLLVTLLVDEDAPSNARVRAFARVSSAVASQLATAPAVTAAERVLVPAC